MKRKAKNQTNQQKKEQLLENRTFLIDTIASQEKAIDNENRIWLKQEKPEFELKLKGDNLTVVNPKYKYEQLPEYQAILKEIIQHKFEEQTKVHEQNIASFEKIIEQAKEKIAEIDEKLKEFGE